MEFQYRGLKGTLEHVEVTEKELDARLMQLQQQHPCVKTVTDRAAKAGDELVLDYAGFADGKQFAGGTAEKQTLVLGSGTFIPGFEEQLLGKNPGDDVTVHVTFPAAYHAPELAGKDAVFRIKVHQITRRSLPEWNDEFARQQGFADVSALRRAVMETAVQKKQAQAAEQFANDLIRQVTEGMTVTIPDAMVENQLDGLINELRGHLQAQGVSLEQYLEAGNTTMEQLSSMMVGRDVVLRIPTTDLPADSITRVTVNGKKLDSKYYTVSSNGSGSIVTLTDAYLATLKAGTYTIKIESATHVSTGTFTIKADGTPKTADAGIALYAVMAVSSLMGTAVVSKKCRKA